MLWNGKDYNIIICFAQATSSGVCARISQRVLPLILLLMHMQPQFNVVLHKQVATQTTPSVVSFSSHSHQVTSLYMHP